MFYKPYSDAIPHQTRYVEELKTFLTFESVSADTSKKQAVADCAKWLCNHLKTLGLKKVKVHAARARLHCDVAVVSDTKMLSASEPAITYSLRGSLNAELMIESLSKDLHSGTFGGMVENPATLLCSIINGIHDANNCIRIPGFYDSVRVVSQQERRFMKRSGPSDQSMVRDTAARTLFGEKG
ncbi:MAG: peptidase dimerization domain-containing protein [Williamsia sp.]|nr:peptidase dimerization domain-containing protein [Williamsia sp.]